MKADVYTTIINSTNCRFSMVLHESFKTNLHKLIQSLSMMDLSRECKRKADEVLTQAQHFFVDFIVNIAV